LLGGSWPRDAHAYRPFDGTDAAVAEPGAFELELGPSYRAGRRMTPRMALPALVLNQGLAEHVELVVDATNEANLRRVPGEPTMRVVDVDLQLKTVLREGSLHDRPGPSIATEMGPLLPRFGGDERWGGNLALIVSHRTSILTIHINGSAASTRDSRYQLTSATIVEGPTSLRVRPVIEVLVSRELGGRTLYTGLVGAIWAASDRLSFDMATRCGALDGLPLGEVRIGFTWNATVWNLLPSARHASRALP
jgi:hypothetical protein